MRKIGVDIDDVLLELAQPFLDFHNATYGTSFQFSQFCSYYLPLFLGGTFEEAVEKLGKFYKTRYFLSLKPVPGAREGISRLQEYAELDVITSRIPELFLITRQQLQQHFPGTLPDSLHFARNPYIGKQIPAKREICTRVAITELIEDSLEHAQECAAAGIHVYLLDYPWNQSSEAIPGVTRVKSWDDITL